MTIFSVPASNSTLLNIYHLYFNIFVQKRTSDFTIVRLFVFLVVQVSQL